MPDDLANPESLHSPIIRVTIITGASSITNTGFYAATLSIAQDSRAKRKSVRFHPR